MRGRPPWVRAVLTVLRLRMGTVNEKPKLEALRRFFPRENDLPVSPKHASIFLRL